MSRLRETKQQEAGKQLEQKSNSKLAYKCKKGKKRGY